jgi:uncharacterized membrane protein
MENIFNKITAFISSKTFDRLVILAFFIGSLIYHYQNKCSTAILFAIYAVLYYLISTKRK